MLYILPVSSKYDILCPIHLILFQLIIPLHSLYNFLILFEVLNLQLVLVNFPKQYASQQALTVSSGIALFQTVQKGKGGGKGGRVGREGKGREGKGREGKGRTEGKGTK
jgi:hypothetical protein